MPDLNSLPIDERLGALLSSPETQDGSLTCRNFYSLTLRSDSVTLVASMMLADPEYVEDSAGVRHPLQAGIRTGALPIVESKDHFFYLKSGCLLVLSPRGELVFDSGGPGSLPEVKGMTNIYKNRETILVRHYRADGSEGLLRFELGKGFTARGEIPRKVSPYEGQKIESVVETLIDQLKNTDVVLLGGDHAWTFRHGRWNHLTLQKGMISFNPYLYGVTGIATISFHPESDMKDDLTRQATFAQGQGVGLEIKAFSDVHPKFPEEVGAKILPTPEDYVELIAGGRASLSVAFTTDTTHSVTAQGDALHKFLRRMIEGQAGPHIQFGF